MRKSVLIADDNPGIRETLSRKFEVEADYYLCAAAVNGREAIDLAVRYRPDLIILDLSMPVMSGLEAYRQLKAMMPEVPIILLTDYGDLLRTYNANLPVDLVIVDKSDPNLMKYVRTLSPA